MEKKIIYHYDVIQPQISFVKHDRFSFLKELGRFIDFRNSIFHSKTIYLDKNVSDYELLLSDWKAVGQDLRDSIEKFEEENIVKK